MCTGLLLTVDASMMARLLLASFLIVQLSSFCIETSEAVLDPYPMFNHTSSHHKDVDYSYAPDTEIEDKFECGFPWADASRDCHCGVSLHETVYCNNATGRSLPKVGILKCSLMTYEKETVVGHSLYGCIFQHGAKKINQIYNSINSTLIPSNFTLGVCGHLHRNETLCGNCERGHYPPVYSYEVKCIKCPNRWYNWVLFVVKAFVPLTIFLVIVLIFRVSATSAQLSAFVLFCQNFSAPNNVYLLIANIDTTAEHPTLSTVLAKAIVAIYGIWNLDFFRSIYKPTCLHVTIMQVILLDYVIAFYPLLLLVFFYFAVKLRINRVCGVRCLWNPMHRTMNSLRNSWNVQRSIIDAFATFFLLSYSKLLGLSFHTLMYTNVHNAKGDRVKTVVYSAANLTYFGEGHWYYGILALFVFVVFICFPVVLLFAYPMRCFQRFLTRMNMNHELLRMFMDSFQGCYKDGTNGTRDCRYFAGVYFLLRILLFLTFGMTLTVLFYSIATILFILMGIVIIIVRPYNDQYKVYNKVDAIMVLNQALITASVLCQVFANIKGERFKTFSTFLVGIFSAVPLIYIIVITVHWIYTRQCYREMMGSVKSNFKENCFSSNKEEEEEEEEEELLNSATRSYGSTIN